MVISHTNESLYVGGMVKCRLGMVKLQTGWYLGQNFSKVDQKKRGDHPKNAYFLLWVIVTHTNESIYVGRLVRCRRWMVNFRQNNQNRIVFSIFLLGLLLVTQIDLSMLTGWHARKTQLDDLKHTKLLPNITRTSKPALSVYLLSAKLATSHVCPRCHLSAHDYAG